MNVHASRESVATSGTLTFAVLGALLLLARTLLLTVVPLNAFAIMGDAQKVASLYLVASLLGACCSLTVPWLASRLRRRWIITGASLCLLTAFALLSLQTVPGFLAGLALQSAGIGTVDIAIYLYVMDHISRQKMNRYEPVRASLSAVAFALGPWLGTYLSDIFASWAPFAASAGAIVIMTVCFWSLPMSERVNFSKEHRRSPCPLHYLPRFFAQPRLRLAYALSAARSGWWSMFSIYVPIYAVYSGYSQGSAGAIVSLGYAWLCTAPIWGIISAKWGVRPVVAVGFIVCAAMTILAALAAGRSTIAITLMLGAALSLAVSESAGNVYFFRAVHGYERVEMTTVYLSYRDVGQTSSSGIFADLLRVFELHWVFLASGCALLCVSFLTKFLPRGL